MFLNQARNQWNRLDFRRSLVSCRSGKERGLLSRTAAGNRAYQWKFQQKTRATNKPISSRYVAGRVELKTKARNLFMSIKFLSQSDNVSFMEINYNSFC